MADPLVTVIVLNRNGRQFLDTCLSSLLGQDYPNYEVFLVDDASTDDSVEYTRQHFPTVRVICSPRNIAFAANNLGIAEARGKYVALINNDTRADPHWLSRMVEVAERDPAIGMCAPKILSIYDEKLIDSVGGLLIYPDGMARGRGRRELDQGQWDRVEEVLLSSGCATLYRKDMLDEIGGFDEDFFAYCEDTDLGLRARLAGWKAVAVPSAVVYHHYSGYWGKYSPRKAFLVERNHLWVIVKNFPASLLWKVPFYTFWRYLFQVYAVFTKQGSAGNFEGSKLGLAWTLLKAYGAAARGLPRMLQKRRAIQRRRRVSDAEVASWFRKYRMSVAELVLRE